MGIICDETQMVQLVATCQTKEKEERDREYRQDELENEITEIVTNLN
jgi:hypothetical protein